MRTNLSRIQDQDAEMSTHCVMLNLATPRYRSYPLVRFLYSDARCPIRLPVTRRCTRTFQKGLENEQQEAGTHESAATKQDLSDLRTTFLFTRGHSPAVRGGGC